VALHVAVVGVVVVVAPVFSVHPETAFEQIVVVAAAAAAVLLSVHVVFVLAHTPAFVALVEENPYLLQIPDSK
jgi:hypothetical protein